MNLSLNWLTRRAKLSPVLSQLPMIPVQKRTVSDLASPADEPKCRQWKIDNGGSGGVGWSSRPSPGADLVTEYDRAVETTISTTLAQKYPDFKCVAHPYLTLHVKYAGESGLMPWLFSHTGSTGRKPMTLLVRWPMSQPSSWIPLTAPLISYTASPPLVFLWA